MSVSVPSFSLPLPLPNPIALAKGGRFVRKKRFKEENGIMIQNQNQNQNQNRPKPASTPARKLVPRTPSKLSSAKHRARVTEVGREKSGNGIVFREGFLAASFELVGMVGAGSFGVVFKAHSKIDQKVYAIKQIKDGAHSNAEQYFQFFYFLLC